MGHHFTNTLIWPAHHVDNEPVLYSHKGGGMELLRHKLQGLSGVTDETLLVIPNIVDSDHVPMHLGMQEQNRQMLWKFHNIGPGVYQGYLQVRLSNQYIFSCLVANWEELMS